MSRFKGVDCPVCRRKFEESGDIVVCPECGTPHHRDCYAELSACKNKELHGGFIWKSPVDNAIHGYAAKEEKEIREETEAETEYSEKQTNDISFFREFIESNGISRGYYDEKRGRFENRDIYGVSEREIVCFQGGKNPFLTEKYRRIANGNKVSFNLMAMLFFPYSAFYSRMRFWGIIMAAVDFALRLPYTLLFLYYNQTITGGAGFIESNESFLIQINSVLGVVQLLYRVFALLFYDYFYLIWMTRRIKGIRTRFIQASGADLDESYYSSLRAAGKPSFLKMMLDSVGALCAFTSVTLLVLYFFC